MIKLTDFANKCINQLAMRKHPEGGYYSESYRAPGQVSIDSLRGHSGPRSFLTSIYFLLSPGDVSRFHRLLSDEIWYYHGGSSLTIHCINEKGAHEARVLGPELSAGQSLQIAVPAGVWFGAIPSGSEACLSGCAVAPGFDFADFELATRQDLLRLFPQHQAIIEVLTSA